MSVAICISTYQRPDGKTPFYLHRALDSIQAQTFRDYQVYLIGDDYGEGLKKFIAPQVKVFNLLRSVEREKYPFGDYRLFCSGGVTPGNIGINYALNDGFEYVCHLDHDDWWEPDHLFAINKMIERGAFFACAVSSYWGSQLPQCDILHEILEYIPGPGRCCLSSSCIKYSDTNIRFRDVFAETGNAYPADADFWTRLAEYMRVNDKKGLISTSLTCYHDEEGYSFRGDFK